MSTIKEMREKQEKLASDARGFLDEAGKNGTTEERVAELETQSDKAFAEYDSLTDKIERAEKLEAIEKRQAERMEQPDKKRRPNGGNGEVSGVDEGETPSYRNAFHSYLRAAGNIGLLTQEERSVLNSGYQKVGAEKRAQTTSTNSEGGFTVPTELESTIVKSMAAWGPMYDENIATVITTSGGGQIQIPTVNDIASTAGASGGEGVTLTDDGGKDVAFGQKALDAYSFDTEWLRVSKELADDSIFAMETLLGELLGERLGRLANIQLTTGSGSGAPNGIVTASAAGKTAASATAVTWDEIMDLEHSVDPAYRNGPKVRYMFNDSTLKYARQIKDGDGNYLWQAGNVQGGVPSSFNGRPYSINQAMDSIATGNKSMLFGDFGKYYVRKVGAPLIGALQDKDFWPGFGVAGFIRFDGELGDAAAIKHLVMA